MRWSSVLLPFSLLSAGVLAEQPSQQFLDFHKKSLASAPVKIDDAVYKKVTAVPRDYSVAVLLTALDSRYACQMCREFGPEWDLLSTSWVKGDKNGDSRVIFSTLDFSDGRDTFMSLGLQTAPVLLFFQPTTGEFSVPDAAEPLRFDFNSGKPSAESVRDWIARHTPGRPHPEVSRPTEWFKIITSVVTIVGGFSALVTVWPYIEPIVTNRKVVAFFCVGFILIHTSGHMFNSIRNVPYAGNDGKGRIAYFAGGFQSQYQLESQIIAALYGALAFTAIYLADKVPRLGSAKLQQLSVIAIAGACVVLYSLLLSIFRIKNGGYPFALPPFL